MGDEQLIAHIRDSTRGAARLLVGLARRGKAIEQAQPQRAARLLGAVVTHPLYKGGRLTFDMLEIEDLMLEEPAIDPPGLAALTDALTIARVSSRPVVDILSRLSAEAEPNRTQGAGQLPLVRLAPLVEVEVELDTESLPELTAADYLFDYVVLGLLDVLSRQP